MGYLYSLGLATNIFSYLIENTFRTHSNVSFNVVHASEFTHSLLLLLMYYPFTKKTKDEFGIVKTSPFGWRKLSGKWIFHEGEDYAPSRNKNGDIEIIASQFGVLRNWRDQYGAMVADINGKDGRRYRNVHLKKMLKSNGNVRAGEVIGLMGSTGLSTGIHDHFAIWNNYNDPTSAINPSLLKLKYYDTHLMDTRDQRLQEAKAWNDTTKVNEYIDLKPSGDIGKLMNSINSKDKEDLLIWTKELIDRIKTTNLPNTEDLDTFFKKLAQNGINSLDY